MVVELCFLGGFDGNSARAHTNLDGKTWWPASPYLTSSLPRLKVFRCPKEAAVGRDFGDSALETPTKGSISVLDGFWRAASIGPKLRVL